MRTMSSTCATPRPGARKGPPAGAAGGRQGPAGREVEWDARAGNLCRQRPWTAGTMSMKTVTSRPPAATTTKARRGLSPPGAGVKVAVTRPFLRAAGAVRLHRAFGNGEIDRHAVHRPAGGVLDGHDEARALGMPHGQGAGLDAQAIPRAVILAVRRREERQAAQPCRHAAQDPAAGISRNHIAAARRIARRRRTRNRAGVPIPSP